MNDVIYSSNPLQVFGVQIAMSVFILGLGIVAIPTAIRQKHSFLGRGIIILFSVIAILAGLFLLGATAYSYTVGTRAMSAKLTQKNVVYSNTSDSAPTPSYRLTLGQTNAFDIPDEGAYNKMTIGECYQLTYYPSLSLGLFSNATQVGE